MGLFARRNENSLVLLSISFPQNIFYEELLEIKKKYLNIITKNTLLKLFNTNPRFPLNYNILGRNVVKAIWFKFTLRKHVHVIHCNISRL